jgi:hydrogenase maturation protein HypF
MELEFAIDREITDDAYPFVIEDHGAIESADEAGREAARGTRARFIVDWEPMIQAVVRDVRDLYPLARISAKFHNTLVEIVVEIARRIAEERVALTGGCFQNKYLLEQAVRRLEAEGFRAYWHQRIPPNDGGIALGQIVAASRLIEARGAGEKG